MSNIIRPLIRPLIRSSPRSPIIDLDPHMSPAYVEAVLALDPVAYWRLDESEGPTAVDEIDGNDLTYNNFAGSAFGQPTALISGDADGSAVEADGVDDYVEGLGVVSAVSEATHLSINFWMKMPDTNPDWVTIIRLADSVSGNQIRFQKSGGNPHLIFQYVSDEANSNSVDALGVFDDNWHMITLVFHGDIRELHGYKNGVLIETAVDTMFRTPAIVNDLYLWSFSSTSSNRGQGMLDEISIHNRSLTDVEVADLYTKSGR